MGSPDENLAAWSKVAAEGVPDAMPLFEVAADLNPRDPDAMPLIERHLIACCVQGDEGVHDAMSVVTSADFAITDHQLVFGAIVRVAESGRDVYAADVFEEVQRSGLLDQLGGTKKFHPWLHETTLMEPTGMHARLHAQSVRDASLFRQLRGVSSEIASMTVRPHGPAADVLADAERLLFDLADSAARKASPVRWVRETLKEAIVRIDDRIAAGGELAGLSTGYPDIDDLLCGLQPGQLVVVGGRPGRGKTAFGVNVLVNVARRGIPTMLFSLEMPQFEVDKRLLAMDSGVSVHSINKAKRLTDAEAAALVHSASAARLGGVAIGVDDTPDSPAARIASQLRREVRRNGVQLAVVDFLQLVRPENPRDNRVQQVGTACRRIRNMAREMNVPVLLLCQLNREVEHRADKKPQLADLRESGEIEQHANAVLLLHTPDQPDHLPVWTTDVIVAKNRNGPVGTATLAYRRAQTRYENYAPGGDARD